MADDVLFEVDASQIIAKLHLAGLQPLSFKAGEFIVNTGIKNDDPKLKPDNPGKITFDLNNSTYEYEVGFVTMFKYHKTYDLEKSLDAISDLLSKTSGDKSDIKDKVSDNKKEYEAIKQNTQFVTKIFSAYGVKADENQLKTADGIKAIKDDALKTIEENDKKSYDELKKKLSEVVAKKLQQYMEGFAGKENIGQIGESTMKMIKISENMKDSNSSGLVDKFEIQPISDQEYAKLVEQFKLNFMKNPDPKNLNCEEKVCFVIKYMLNVDK